ncbi:hypothetical protein, partial [uncultured Rikenella sp.]|uniref:hypothetical protein n=1 Tax=uncultured Rikenella sp. TaxID=368003 RepID=UPI002606CEC6
QNVPAHFDDFPFKASARGSSFDCPRAGQAPRARGGQLAGVAQLFEQFSVRAPWEIQSKRASTF